MTNLFQQNMIWKIITGCVYFLFQQTLYVKCMEAQLWRSSVHRCRVTNGLSGLGLKYPEGVGTEVTNGYPYFKVEARKISSSHFPKSMTHAKVVSMKLTSGHKVWNICRYDCNMHLVTSSHAIYTSHKYSYNLPEVLDQNCNWKLVFWWKIRKKTKDLFWNFLRNDE